MKNLTKPVGDLYPHVKKLTLIMRLSVLLILIAVFTSTASVYSQATRLTVKMENVRLSEVFDAIEEQSEFYFFYNRDYFNDDRIVSVDVENKLVDEVLKELLQDEEITWEIFDRNILLRIPKAPLTTAQREVMQQRTVSGVVTDQRGFSLPGVTIVVKGTTTGTVTNADGNYSLTNIPEDATLVFSFVGMRTQEVVVESQARIDVRMEEETIGIEEVVAVGYGTMKKSDLTGSVASISSEEISANPYMNVAQSIQGKVSGIDIYSTAHTPGAAPTIRVRGNRSINASNDPLYVVDGIAFEGNLNDINSNDIESIDILKDASATAIYGSRGANGVVLITTRRGKEGKISVNYNGYYGTQIANKINLMDGAEIAELRREAQRNRGNYDSDTPMLELDKNMFYYPDKYMIESVSAGYGEDGSYDPSKVKSYNWVDQVTRLGRVQDHQINILGGNNNTKTSFSAGYFENEGVVRWNGYSKYSIRLTIDQMINDWVDFGGSFATSINKDYGTSNIYQMAAQTNPLSPFYDENGDLQKHPSSEMTSFNALLVGENDLFERFSNLFYGSFFTEVKLTNTLKYRMNFGPDYKTGRRGYLYSQQGTRIDGESRATNETYNQFHFTLDNLLYYDKIFNEIHKLGITVLQSIEQYNYENLNGSVNGLPYEHQKWFNLGSATTITGLNSNYSQWKLYSLMGRVNYNFNEKYLATLTGRYDGSSRLAQGRKFTFFPSAAFSWRIIEEPFMENMSLFNNLKLRIGYGATGNTALSPYQTLGSLTRTSYSSGDDGFLGYAPSSLSNSNLGWETTKQYNLGIDFSLLNSRLSGTIDVYRQNTHDLLLSRNLPIASGFSSVIENVGSTRNTGLEISLSGIVLKSANGFNWDADIMFYTNKEEIMELYSGKIDDIGNKWFIGYPINTYYDYKFDGIWQDTEEDKALIAKYNANGSSYAPGEIRLYDKDGNETINAEDRVILGSNVPKWTGSINSRMEYKGFDFLFFIYTRQGQMVYSTMNNQYEGRYNWLSVNYWTPENQSNSFPRPQAAVQTPLNFSSIGYRDGSFIKLKTVTLGYTFPHKIISALHMDKLRIYITAQNPYMYTKFWGIDPEGALNFSYPSSKTFMFGISTSF